MGSSGVGKVMNPFPAPMTLSTNRPFPEAAVLRRMTLAMAMRRCYHFRRLFRYAVPLVGRRCTVWSGRALYEVSQTRYDVSLALRSAVPRGERNDETAVCLPCSSPVSSAPLSARKRWRR